MKSEKERFQLRKKLWIVDEQDAVLFGDGRLTILEIIRETGSMNKAAMELGMSYRTLWGKVRDTEERLGYKLVKNRSGNRRSGSCLTPEGEIILKKFSKLKDAISEAADRIFSEIF